MAVQREHSGASLIDVLDRVLDKGIVIDAWVRVSLVGIDLITVEARVVVASIDTYLKYSEAVGITGPSRSRELAAASNTQADLDRLTAENAELRRKLESDSHHPHYIRTERGIGYVFTMRPTEAADTANRTESA